MSDLGGSTRARLTEADQRAAIAKLRQRATEGVITDDRLAELTAEVWRSNTPHELHHRTGGLVGERARGDWRDRRRVAALWIAVLLALVVLTWLTAMAAKDGLFTGS